MIPKAMIKDFASPNPYAYPLLIRHLLHTPLATAPHQEIVHGTMRYGYDDLASRIEYLAGGLASLGVKPGATVAVMDWDSHRYLECFFAIPMMGAVLHTVNVRLSPAQILYTINHAEDDFILVHRDFVPLLTQIKDHIERPCRFLVLGDDPGSSPDQSGLDFESEYETLVDAKLAFEFQDFEEHTRATTFYTTGTTGDPKGVYYSHRQLVLHTLGLSAALGAAPSQGRFHREDVYMPITPMFHVHGWGMPYMATLLGVKQVYPGRYEPEKLLALIAEEDVTFSHCVPTILTMLLNSPSAATTDLSRWKVIIGGSALPQGLARAALAMGIDVFTGYGMSETAPVLTLAQLSLADLEGSPAHQLHKRCLTGRPVPMVDLRVHHERDGDLPHDGASTGEVVVRAPWLTQGYFKNPDTSAALWRDGYLHTGDIGHIDEQGQLKVTDRLKDVIKSGGEWISSLALEDIVSQLAGVGEVAAVGIADEKWGERPLLVVAPSPEQDPPTVATIKAHIAKFVDEGTISRWAIPQRIEIVQAIHKTSVGKIDKKRLRATTPKAPTHPPARAR